MRRLLLLVLILISIRISAQTPTISDFSPLSGAVGTLVKITGTNLSSPTALSIGGVPAIVVSNTGTELVAMVMPGASSGTISITSAGGTAISSSNFNLSTSPNQWVQQGNKLVGTGALGTAQQGYSVSLSADGNTALVGGYLDDGNKGAVWVYTRSNGVWSQQGNKLVGTGAVGTAAQGISVALSADGNTALVGGFLDNSGVGAAWVFTRSNGVWSQQGNKLVGTGAVANAQQGYSVSLSADGNTALVGGTSDDGNKGAVWVYTRSNGVWSQQGNKLVGTGAVGNALQGYSVSLSADGNTALVGGTGDDNTKGAAWVFIRSNGVWTQQGAKLLGTDAVGNVELGSSVALSADGNTALVSGTSDDNYKGAAWVFIRSGNTWTQQGNKLVGSGAVGQPYQGFSVSLSADGNTALIGAPFDDGNIGQVWVHRRINGVWTQQRKLIGTGSTGTAAQGICVSLSADGVTALAGGYIDNSNEGAAWVFTVPPSPIIFSVNKQYVKPGDLVEIKGVLFTGATALKIGTQSVGSFFIADDATIRFTAGSTEMSGLISVTTPQGIANGPELSIDNTPPKLTLSNSTGTGVTRGIYTLTLTFSEPVVDLRNTLLSVNEVNGQPAATLNTLTAVNPGLVYTVQVTPLIPGNIIIGSQLAGNAKDRAGILLLPMYADTVVYDNTTAVPVLVSPAANASIDSLLQIGINLPETARANSVQLSFSPQNGGSAIVWILSGTSTENFTINPYSNPTVNPRVQSATANSIPKGVYTVTLSYQDQYANPAAIVSNTNIRFKGHYPSDLQLSAVSINENNSIGAVVASLSSTDADTGDTFTYSLVSGQGDADNASFSINGTELKAAVAFDFESKSTYSIRVRTTDDAGLSFDKIFSISVTDVGESPIITSISKLIAKSGDVLVVTGSNFSGVTAVKIGNVAVNFAIINANRLELTAGATEATGVLTITNAFGTTTGNTSIGIDNTPPRVDLSTTAVNRVSQTPYTVLLTFSEAVEQISPNPLIVKPFNGQPMASLGPMTTVTPGLVYSMLVTPLIEGQIVLLNPNQGIARDLAGNPTESVAADSVLYDVTTQPPVLVSPVANASVGALLSISTALPERAKPNTIQLTFTPQIGGGTPIHWILSGDTNVNFTINPATDPTLNPRILSATANNIPKGIYTITLRYQDQYGNPIASVSNANINFIGFNLPASNFRLAVTNETCKSSNNGKINITASEALDYTLRLTKSGTLINSYDFRTTLNLENLTAGNYSACITVRGQPDYNQCFDAIITEPQDLTVYSTVAVQTSTLTLSLQGGNTYNVKLNGETQRTASSEITLNLQRGLNKLLVSTDQVCQGVYEEEIFINEPVEVYPNPFEHRINIKLGENTGKLLKATILNASGTIVYEAQHRVINQVLSLDLSQLNSGVYFLKIGKSTYKIVKK